MKRLISLLPALCITLASFVQASEDSGKEARRQLLRTRVLDHFMLGIDAPIEWMNETRDKNGAKWDARVQYFSGGAAKEQSWDTVFLNPWNKFVNPKKEKGVWGEKMFIKPTLDSNYIAWITFYNLAQSNPSDYKPDPPHATQRNMTIPETMRAYFEQIKLLMQICDAHKPKPIVVQIEPDEWGHMLLSAKMDPAAVNVKVGATGMPELKDLPDNLIGYAHAIKILRDMYAPTNVLLACNPSGWDSKGSMSGKKFGEYLNKCGCNEWELACFETGDRDKGMSGKAPPYGNTAGIAGSFDEHIRWIKEFHQTTGLYVFVWQVAMGNTYFSTCDNTPGHYCDNLAQTLLEDYPKNPMVARYVEAGCAGWMFNAGQGDSTHVFDQRKDGITNPTPISGNLGHKAEYPDDDGGYLRLRAGMYYKSPYPIIGKSSPMASSSGSDSSAYAPKPAKPAATKAPVVKVKVDEAALSEWEQKLRQKIGSATKSGHLPQAYLKVFGPKGSEEKFTIAGFEGENLIVDVQGNKMPVNWKNVDTHDRAALAKAMAADDDVEALLIAAIYLSADGLNDQAEELFAKAALKDSGAAQAARSILKPAESPPAEKKVPEKAGDKAAAKQCLAVLPHYLSAHPRFAMPSTPL